MWYVATEPVLANVTGLLSVYTGAVCDAAGVAAGAVGVGVRLDDTAGVAVRVGVGVRVGVTTAEPAGVRVRDTVGVGVRLDDTEGVFAGADADTVAVTVGVNVGVTVAVTVAVTVGVTAAVDVIVGVGVEDGSGVADGRPYRPATPSS